MITYNFNAIKQSPSWKVDSRLACVSELQTNILKCNLTALLLSLLSWWSQNFYSSYLFHWLRRMSPGCFKVEDRSTGCYEEVSRFSWGTLSRWWAAPSRRQWTLPSTTFQSTTHNVTLNVSIISNFTNF